jgi:glycosyltransferase involved in cell wall biosynthesis
MSSSVSGSHAAPWIVAQLGAREHYVLARQLHEDGRLHALLTDAWVPPASWHQALPDTLQSLFDRFHEDLDDAPVVSSTPKTLAFEIEARLRGWTGWTRMIRRNQWFERYLVHTAQTHNLFDTTPPPVVFAYSYAAHDLFVEAKKHGATCVLGQIDAGPHEEDIVAAEHERYPRYREQQVRAPDAYWRRWKDECDLADAIVVNSTWSKQALAEAGVTGDHIHVVPLAYTPSELDVQPTYPAAFTDERPLRVLYLGTLTLRKGLARMLDAAHQLNDQPIEFWVVGGGTMEIPTDQRQQPNVRWFGHVPRSDVGTYYQNADLFLFPTLSDGFGLTQLEAQAHGLPVFSSQRCGDVVTDGHNGRRLGDVTPDAIADALRWAVNHPSSLSEMGERSRDIVPQFSPERVVDQLLDVVETPKTSPSRPSA